MHDEKRIERTDTNEYYKRKGKKKQKIREPTSDLLCEPQFSYDSEEKIEKDNIFTQCLSNLKQKPAKNNSFEKSKRKTRLNSLTNATRKTESEEEKNLKKNP